MEIAANGVAADRSPRPIEGDLVVLTASAPSVELSVLCALFEGPIAVFRSVETDADGRAWSIAGFGEAARVEGVGASRIADVRAKATRLFEAIRPRRCSIRGGRVELASDSGDRSLDGPSLRLFGGVSFKPESRAAGAPRSIEPGAPPWAAFNDASFTLPRWLYARSGEREARLSLAAPRDEESQAKERLAAMIARLHEASLSADREQQIEHARASASIVSDGEAPSTTAHEWRAMVIDALNQIRAHKVEKVVAAAMRRVVLAEPIAIAPVIERLSEAYPECARFAFQRGSATFVGASPERLVSVRGLCVEADGLAGSARRAAGNDAMTTRALLESDKDRREHTLVVSAIAAALRPRCRSLHVPAAPTIKTLRNVHHLWTPIEGDLARPTHVLDLVELLHPTPAVCGWPRDAAMNWIASREAEPRGWYAGAVGWFDASGDGSFAVAIRSGLLEGDRAWIYAGAGLVEGSSPDAELAETRVKQAPILAALGLAP